MSNLNDITVARPRIRTRKLLNARLNCIYAASRNSFALQEVFCFLKRGTCLEIEVETIP